ncbi:gas vesicle protein [Rhodococcus opacus M213]|uniref:Gas vesicle protein A n=1 Tax=Rhodococcus opacus M213 TaxID=1129896 RepID=K8Y1D0_RHOOP|nr:gas vesicle protein [Rhodococcus opacus M213]
MTTAGGPSSSSLADVIDTILDKGLVIDAYVRVSLVGIELLTIDARIVVASVDTYLRFAEAANRLAIGSEPKGLSDLVSGGTEKIAKSKTKRPSKRSSAACWVGKRNPNGNGCRASRLEVTGDGYIGAGEEPEERERREVGQEADGGGVCLRHRPGRRRTGGRRDRGRGWEGGRRHGR